MRSVFLLPIRRVGRAWGSGHRRLRGITTRGMRLRRKWPACMRVSGNVTAPVIVLTPNLCGFDGISRLSRLVVDTFDEVTVLALHEPRSVTRLGRARVSGAGGRSSSFAAA